MLQPAVRGAQPIAAARGRESLVATKV